MKTVFLTGASSGIGKACAEMLYEQGWTLGISARHKEDLKKVSLNWDQQRVTCYEFDVANAADFKQAIDDFASKSGGTLDLLINNAGILNVSPFEQLPVSEHQRIINVNVMSIIHGCHAAFPYLKASSNAQVINISSASSVYGIPEFASYSASKSAVKALTEALDLEWQAHGIKVCDVVPPFVSTHMLESQNRSSKIMESLGVDLEAKDVAKVILKQIHRAKTHRPVSLKFSLLYHLNSVTPAPISRFLIKSLST